jgi:flagellar protein FliL
MISKKASEEPDVFIKSSGFKSSMLYQILGRNEFEVGDLMNTVYVRKMSQFLLVWLTLGAPLVMASGGGQSFAEGLNYLPIKPSIVANYGGEGKIRYIKAEISMRVESKHAAEEVSHHMPLVRDTLIMYMSSLNDADISTGEGKDAMRQEALRRLNDALDLQMGHTKTKKEDAEDNHKKEDKKHKSKKAKDTEEDAHADAEHQVGPLVSDLLFDNFVVQK